MCRFTCRYAAHRLPGFRRGGTPNFAIDYSRPIILDPNLSGMLPDNHFMNSFGTIGCPPSCFPGLQLQSSIEVAPTNARLSVSQLVAPLPLLAPRPVRFRAPHQSPVGTR